MGFGWDVEEFFLISEYLEDSRYISESVSGGWELVVRFLLSVVVAGFMIFSEDVDGNIELPIYKRTWVSYFLLPFQRDLFRD